MIICINKLLVAITIFALGIGDYMINSFIKNISRTKFPLAKADTIKSLENLVLLNVYSESKKLNFQYKNPNTFEVVYNRPYY